MPEVILLAGYPASGKSTVAKRYIERGYVHLNRDSVGGRVADLVPNMVQALKTDKNVILDNTFPTKESRRPFIQAVAEWAACGEKGGREADIVCLLMDTSIEDAQFNASWRMMERYGHILTPPEIKAVKHPNIFPVAVLFAYRKQFEFPTEDEGFTMVQSEAFVRHLPKDCVNKALILDYDGCLRETKSGAKYPLTADDIRILPGRAKRLKELAKKWRLFGVSNQSGVAKGDLTLEQARDLFDATNQMLGVPIETYFCPHGPAPITCYCRKPLPALGVQAIYRHKLNPAECVMVGDLTSDKTFAKRCGFQFRQAEDFFK